MSSAVPAQEVSDIMPTNLTSLNVGGMPIAGGRANIPFSTGKYFIVNNSKAKSDDGNVGSESFPLSTVAAAVGKCTANNGDVILLGPGHAETISAATSLVVDVAGISIVGLGNGRNRPVLSFSATASRIPVSADDVLIENIVCLGAVADIVSGITVTGDDVTIRGNEIASGGAALEFLQFLDVDAASRAIIEGNMFRASETAGSNTGLRLDTATDAIIRGNEFRGDWTTAAISGNAGSAAASTGLAVEHNKIQNLDTTAGLVIDMHNDSTGLISDNRGFTLFATAPETALDPGDCLCCENYVVNAVDESGTIVPVTLST